MGELGCREIEERLPWLLNGTLAPEERAELEAHLAGCASCTAALAATRRASALFAAHAEPATLVDYVIGLPVAAESRAALELHLAHCLECQEELRLVGAESGEEVADTLDAATLRAIPARSPRAQPRWFRSVALAAAVALSSGLAVFVAMRDRGAPPGIASGRVALVELWPESSRTRGGETVEIAVSAAVNSALLLATDRAESFDEVRARIVRRAGGRALREEPGLLPAPGGYALLLRAGSLPAEPSGTELEIVLEGRLADAWSPLGRYRLRLEP